MPEVETYIWETKWNGNCIWKWAVEVDLLVYENDSKISVICQSLTIGFILRGCKDEEWGKQDMTGIRCQDVTREYWK